MLSDSTLGEFFRAPIDIPEIPFGEMLWESAQRFPEKTALVFQGQKISYRELDGLANSCANALAKVGVKKGDRVALYMTNRPEYVISVYGIARLGAVFTPMNPTYKEGEIEHQLNDAEASVLVVQESLYPLVRTTRPQLPSLQEIIIVGQRAEAGTHLFRELIRQAQHQAGEAESIGEVAAVRLNAVEDRPAWLRYWNAYRIMVRLHLVEDGVDLKGHAFVNAQISHHLPIRIDSGVGERCARL